MVEEWKWKWVMMLVWVWETTRVLGEEAALVEEELLSGGAFKYKLKWQDPFGAVVALAAFGLGVALASGTVLLWCCVDEATEPSVFPAGWPRFGANARAVKARDERIRHLAAEADAAPDTPNPRKL